MSALNNKIIQLYRNGCSAPIIATKIGCSSSTIYRILRNNEVSVKKKLKLEAFKTNIIEKYKLGNSIGDIAKEFNCTRYCVKNILVFNGINLRGPKEYCRKYNIDELFFCQYRF